jgi:hypothetical protein
MQTKVEVFFSCSQNREDEELRNELERHLGLLIQEGFINVWHRGKLNPGVEDNLEVETHLNKAHIILLLISANFIASHSCYHLELKRAMERHAAGQARVIPVILHAVDLEIAEFTKLQILPMNKKPLTSWQKLDEALSHVAENIRKIVEEIAKSNQAQVSVEEIVDKTYLYNTLVRLDYREQVRVFQQFKNEKRQIGLFFIHGAPSYGQSWLLNRLVRQLPYNSVISSFKFSFERKACGRSLKDLWSELAKWVGLQYPSFPMDLQLQQEIVKRVHRLWQTHTVILILSKLHEIDEQYVNNFMQAFWQPLSEMARNTQSQYPKHYLLAFLVDNTNCLDNWSIPAAKQLDQTWEPAIPIKLDKLSPFSFDVLENWIGYEVDTLPSSLTAQSILANSENGIPELVLEHVCELFGYDWLELVKYRL